MRKAQFVTGQEIPGMQILVGLPAPRGPIRTNPVAPQSTDVTLMDLIRGFGSPGAADIDATVADIGRVPYYD